jgi:C4-dicarboxylate-specific signal transduction histidine kinase
MLGDLLHTMGNKVANARSHLPMLRLPGLDERRRHEQLAGLERDLDRVADIVGKFRAGFDPTRGAFRQAVDVNRVMTAVANNADVPAAANVQVEVQLTEPGPVLFCNEFELEMALKMLFQNAVEAVGTRRGVVRLRTRTTRRHIVVTVADNGAGMDRDTRRSCTRPFFTTKPNGDGLGLTVASGVVSRQHGRLRIASARGKGTLCSLVFPGHRP